MAQRTTNTIQELLQKVASQVAQFMQAAPPDELDKAHELLAFVTSMSQQPIQDMQSHGQMPAGAGGAPPSFGSPPPSDLGGGGAGMGGIMPSPQIPPQLGNSSNALRSTDTLRRLLSPAQ